MQLEHGIIGNGSLIALIHPDSGVDWLCLPRFDSESIFARLLDEERGGTWRFLIDGEPVRGRMKYVRNTNVLMTEFTHNGSVFRVFDWASRIPYGLTTQAPLRVFRLLVPVEGEPQISMQFDPRPGYGGKVPRFVPRAGGIEMDGAQVPITLFSNVPAPYILNGQSFRLDRPRYFGLCSGVGLERPHLDEVRRDLDLTIAGWRQWAQSIALPGFADQHVIRSALCLKLHTYQETGAIIAASTTSIPESIGHGRNWDYRYCWLRDAVFTVEALRRLAHFQEGRSFIMFLRDVADGGPLQPLYGIGGERDLPEREVPHLRGYRGSGPVRVGNAAALQTQHDLMGEVVLCLRTLLLDPRVEFHEPTRWFPLVERMVNEAREATGEEDLGIWEYRDRPAQYTFSQAMCWAALHHGAAIARHFQKEPQASGWQREADSLREEILRQAWNEEEKMFTQSLGGSFADASNLLLPALGLVSATDPRFLSTLDRYQEILVRGKGVMRYVHEDDFGAPTSAFTICSFWYVEALALAGRLEEAIEMFHQVASCANPVGLLSEDFDLESEELLGNFPQAYTHVGLINAATTIGTILQARDGRFSAWS